MKKLDDNDKMVLLNEELRSDFLVETLDERLETDPLMLPNMLNVHGLADDGGADVDLDGEIKITVSVEF
ncbi:hypothetical protein [uncultured Rikenella sp.]|uniref:hypothetical protein n=1 Tax=uncultured Rikenella sp. TaxID=368003 RepID=UPI00272A2447|nr:hypothetical protein [uncultured Rikenella sp.]